MKKIISITFATVLAFSSVFISVGCSGEPADDPNANTPIDPTSPEDDLSADKKKAEEDKAAKDGGVGFGEQKEPKATPAPVPTPTKPDGE